MSEFPWPEMKKPTEDTSGIYGKISGGTLVPR